MPRLVAGDGVTTAAYLVYVGDECVAGSNSLAVATVYLRLCIATLEAYHAGKKN